MSRPRLRSDGDASQHDLEIELQEIKKQKATKARLEQHENYHPTPESSFMQDPNPQFHSTHVHEPYVGRNLQYKPALKSR